ncbi:uncharacterized protein PG998_008421 [Apiospora kogelbergensis]
MGLFVSRRFSTGRRVAKFELSDDMSRLFLSGSELAPVIVPAYDNNGARVVELADVKVIDDNGLPAEIKELKCSVTPGGGGSGPVRDPVTGTLVPGTLLACKASVDGSTYGPVATGGPQDELYMAKGFEQFNGYFRAEYGATCDSR